MKIIKVHYPGNISDKERDGSTILGADSRMAAEQTLSFSPTYKKKGKLNMDYNTSSQAGVAIYNKNDIHRRTFIPQRPIKFTRHHIKNNQNLAGESNVLTSVPIKNLVLEGVGKTPQATKLPGHSASLDLENLHPSENEPDKTQPFKQTGNVGWEMNTTKTQLVFV